MGKVKNGLRTLGNWIKGSTAGNGKWEFGDFFSLNPKANWNMVKSQFTGGRSVSSSSGQGDSDLDGLKISDAFGDDIRAMQQAAADKQMAYQTLSAREAMCFSADEAQKNRDWQEKMSNSAYTRAVSDLKNAGLNPVLAVSGMSGASTPAGSSATGIAQTGSQAQVSEYNSALEVLSVLMSGITDIISSAKGLDTKRFKVGF